MEKYNILANDNKLYINKPISKGTIDEYLVIKKIFQEIIDINVKLYYKPVRSINEDTKLKELGKNIKDKDLIVPGKEQTVQNIEKERIINIKSIMESYLYKIHKLDIQKWITKFEADNDILKDTIQFDYSIFNPAKHNYITLTEFYNNNILKLEQNSEVKQIIIDKIKEKYKTKYKIYIFKNNKLDYTSPNIEIGSIKTKINTEYDKISEQKKKAEICYNLATINLEIKNITSVLGISNIVNTCFINTSIQSILNNKLLLSEIFKFIYYIINPDNKIQLDTINLNLFRKGQHFLLYILLMYDILLSKNESNYNMLQNNNFIYSSLEEGGSKYIIFNEDLYQGTCKIQTDIDDYGRKNIMGDATEVLEKMLYRSINIEPLFMNNIQGFNIENEEVFFYIDFSIQNEKIYKVFWYNSVKNKDRFTQTLTKKLLPLDFYLYLDDTYIDFIFSDDNNEEENKYIINNKDNIMLNIKRNKFIIEELFFKSNRFLILSILLVEETTYFKLNCYFANNIKIGHTIKEPKPIDIYIKENFSRILIKEEKDKMGTILHENEQIYMLPDMLIIDFAAGVYVKPEDLEEHIQKRYNIKKEENIQMRKELESIKTDNMEYDIYSKYSKYVHDLILQKITKKKIRYNEKIDSDVYKELSGSIKFKLFQNDEDMKEYRMVKGIYMITNIYYYWRITIIYNKWKTGLNFEQYIKLNYTYLYILFNISIDKKKTSTRIERDILTKMENPDIDEFKTIGTKSVKIEFFKLIQLLYKDYYTSEEDIINYICRVLDIKSDEDIEIKKNEIVIKMENPDRDIFNIDPSIFYREKNYFETNFNMNVFLDDKISFYNNKIYKLQSAMEHVGTSHWISYIYRENKWWICDDKDITEISSKDLSINLLKAKTFVYELVDRTQ